MAARVKLDFSDFHTILEEALRVTMKVKLNKTFLSKRPSASSFVVAFLGLLTLLMFFTLERENLSASGSLIFEEHQYWRAFTTTLLHGDLNHLAHNAFFFTGLAALLHNYFGVLVFPVLSFLAGGLINILTLAYYPPEVHLVGVSGVIYFMASFWLVLYILIERRHSLIVRIMQAMGVTLIFLFPQVFQPEVSYLAHGMGFLIGIPVGAVYYLFNRKRIRAQDEWIEVEKKHSEMEDIILLDSSFYHQVEPEVPGPFPPVSDSSQSRQH